MQCAGKIGHITIKSSRSGYRKFIMKNFCLRISEDDSEIKKSSLIVPKIQKSKGVKIPLPVDGYFWIVVRMNH